MKEPADVKMKLDSSKATNSTASIKKVAETKEENNNQQQPKTFPRSWLFCRKRIPKMYLKTIERLGLYVSKKNMSNEKKCLKQEKIVKPVVPGLTENHTAQENGNGNII